MYVLLLCIRLRDPAEVPGLIASFEAAACALPAVRSHMLQPAIEIGPADPQILWRICFDSEADLAAMRTSAVWLGEIAARLQPSSGVLVESVFYRRRLYSVPYPDFEGGIWRALMMTVKEGVGLETRRRFEREMAMMPRYISTIRNWAFNPVIASHGSRRWSYVFEQDFDDVAGLIGEYRMHPIHYGLVDRWFDAEHPEHILDSRLLRVVCNSPSGAIDPRT